jgi:hypothetical protein
VDVTRPPPQPTTPLVQAHKTTSSATVVQTQNSVGAEITRPLPQPPSPASSSEWTPSGADIARRQPPREGLPVFDAVGLRARGPRFPDGVKWVEQRLSEIATLTRLGVPVTVVFDLDNTVFDTRHRTLQALRDFDRQGGTHHFDGVSVADVQLDAGRTASKLGLADDVIEAAQAFWKTSFWTPASLAHDAPIADMVALVHRARAAGAGVKFLTGRTQPFHAASLAQLRAAGVDVDDADVVCKPDVATATAPYKEQQMTAWAQQAELGFFVTEGVRDLEHMQSFFRELPLLRLGCSFEDGEKLAGIPLWPAAF